jgi:hypothetical protein
VRSATLRLQRYAVLLRLRTSRYFLYRRSPQCCSPVSDRSAYGRGRFDETTDLVENASALTHALARHRRIKGVASTRKT